MVSETISRSEPEDKAVRRPYNGQAKLVVEVPSVLGPALDEALGGVPGVDGELGSAKVVQVAGGFAVDVPLGWVAYVADCWHYILNEIYPPRWQRLTQNEMRQSEHRPEDLTEWVKRFDKP
jgi:hypothetical protein